MLQRDPESHEHVGLTRRCFGGGETREPKVSSIESRDQEGIQALPPQALQ